jgi:hypothetical protein
MERIMGNFRMFGDRRSQAFRPEGGGSAGRGDEAFFMAAILSIRSFGAKACTAPALPQLAKGGLRSQLRLT